MFWYCRNVIFCGTPFSVTMKSSGFSPSTDLPFFSTTVTSSVTKFVVVLKVGTAASGWAFVPGALVGIGGGTRAGGCWPLAATKTASRSVSPGIFTPGRRMFVKARSRILELPPLEPEIRANGHLPHVIRRGRRAKLFAERGYVTRVNHVVEDVGGSYLKIHRR